MEQGRDRKRWWIVSIIGVLALITWALVAPQITDAANGETTQAQQVQRGEDNRNRYQRPGVMRDRHRQGDYDNARGIRLAAEIPRLAKRFCENNPSRCPRSVPTKGQQRGGACDGVWSWMKWTCERLETTHCLAVILSQSWLGCDHQPSWVHDVRRVEIICGGDALVAILARAAPVVAGAATHCFYEGVYKTWLDSYQQD